MIIRAIRRIDNNGIKVEDVCVGVSTTTRRPGTIRIAHTTRVWSTYCTIIKVDTSAAHENERFCHLASLQLFAKF